MSSNLNDEMLRAFWLWAQVDHRTVKQHFPNCNRDAVYELLDDKYRQELMGLVER